MKITAYIEELQATIKEIKHLKHNGKWDKICEKIVTHIELIDFILTFLEKELPDIKNKIKFDIKYFNYFKKDFKNEKDLILPVFEKNNPIAMVTSIPNKRLEVDRLEVHNLTIINFLKNIHKVLFDNNRLNQWEIVSFNQEAYEYYKPLLKKKGQDLIKELQKITKNVMRFPNTIKFFADIDRNYELLWSLFKRKGFKDLERNKEQFILDIYSKNPIGPDRFNFQENNQAGQTSKGKKKYLGSEYHREHIIPKSTFPDRKKDENLKYETMICDAHHIFPVDGVSNSRRLIYNHGVVVYQDQTKEFANESKIGFDKDNERVFEPVDAFKGDVARSYLYFAIRYVDRFKDFKTKTVFETNYPYVKDKYLKTMIDWHENIDLVDMYDLNRNEEIYYFQNNRNPFIDIPYLSKLIWNQNYRNVELTFNKI